MTNQQEKYADKIAKLLAKAESTTPEEAELLISKAQELMSQYAVEQAMIDHARGVEREQIETRKIYFTGNYRRELLSLAWIICRANNCLGVQFQTTHDDGGRKAVKVFPDGYGGYRATTTSAKKALCLEVTGFTSDLDRVLLLESSLRLQSTTAQVTWWKANKVEYETYARKVRMRQEFMEGFVSAVSQRLAAAKRVGQKAAEKTEAERTGQTEQQASESVALVLRSRKDQVQDWYDQKYGRLGKARRSYRQTVSRGAHVAGSEAGQRADIGQSRVSGRKSLGQ